MGPVFHKGGVFPMSIFGTCSYKDLVTLCGAWIRSLSLDPLMSLVKCMFHSWFYFCLLRQLFFFPAMHADHCVRHMACNRCLQTRQLYKRVQSNQSLTWISNDKYWWKWLSGVRHNVGAVMCIVRCLSQTPESTSFIYIYWQVYTL